MMSPAKVPYSDGRETRILLQIEKVTSREWRMLNSHGGKYNMNVQSFEEY